MVNLQDGYSPYNQVFEILRDARHIKHRKKLRHLWFKFGLNFLYESRFNPDVEKVPSEDICFLLTKSVIACDIMEAIDEMNGENSMIDIIYHGNKIEKRYFSETEGVTFYFLTSRKYSVVLRKPKKLLSDIQFHIWKN